MAENQIKLFANAGETSNSDVLSLEEYEADTERQRGNQTGIARRELVNTFSRQVSLMSVGLATYIANRYSGGVKDINPLSNPSGQAVTLIEQGISAAIASDLASNTNFGTSVAGTANAFVKSNAQGTINFSTTGNAATATKLATARTITATGNAVTMTNTTFDGSANLTLNITGLNASMLNTGTVPVGRLSAVTQSENGVMLAADKTKLDQATNVNTANALVKRGASGEIAVGALTATSVTGTLSGSGTNITALNASNISTGILNADRLPTLNYLSTSGGTVNGAVTVNATMTIGPTGNNPAILPRTHEITAIGNSQNIFGTVWANEFTGNAASATKLATSRTIQTNLASTTAVSFNGSANVSPGVTGTLGIANGGTGATITTGSNGALAKLFGSGQPSGGVDNLYFPVCNGNTVNTTGWIPPQVVRNAMGLGNTLGALPVANGGTGVTSSTALASLNVTTWEGYRMRSGAGLTGQVGYITFTW